MTARSMAQARPVQAAVPKTSAISIAFSLAIAAVGFAVFSRLAVRYLGIPAAINFVHFPLALGAFVVAPPPVSSVARRTARLIGVFAGVVLLSGVLAATEPLRMALAWLVWVEPVLILYVVYLGISPGYPGYEKRSRTALACLAAVVLAQFVFMTFQIPQRAFRNDGMQGTFVGGQTAAHLAPAVALLGSIVLISAALEIRMRPTLRFGLIAGASYGFLLALLGRANAVVATGLGAVVLLLLAESLMYPKRFSRTAAGLSIGAFLLLGTVLLLPRLGTAPSVASLENGFALKAYAPERLAEEMTRNPAIAVLGQGPGTTVSRVALESEGGVIADSAPHAVLGLQATDFTREMVAFRSANPAAGSSLFQPWSSLLGIVGDLGLLGLLAYMAMWWPCAHQPYQKRNSARPIVTGVVVLAAALGAQQVYLEDPGFVLTVALLLAVAAESGWRLGTRGGRPESTTVEVRRRKATDAGRRPSTILGPRGRKRRGTKPRGSTSQAGQPNSRVWEGGVPFKRAGL